MNAERRERERMRRFTTTALREALERRSGLFLQELRKALTQDTAKPRKRRTKARSPRARTFLLAAGLLCGAAPLGAQEPERSSTETAVTSEVTGDSADPLAVPTTAESWLLQQRVWSEDARAKDLPGARVNAQLGAGRWGFTTRVEYSGLPSEFDAGRIETVRAAVGYLSARYNVARVAGKVTLAPIAILGAAATLETKDGLRAQLSRRVTVAGGLSVSGDSWTVRPLVGQHHSFPGLALGAAWDVHVAGSPRGAVGEIRNTGLGVCPLTGPPTERRCVAETAIVVRVR